MERRTWRASGTRLGGPRSSSQRAATARRASGGARRKAGQPEAVARRPGVAAARASKGSGPVACTTSRLLLVALGPPYDVDFPLVKLQKNPVPLQAPRRIAVEEGDCVVPPPPIRSFFGGA